MLLWWCHVFCASCQVCWFLYIALSNSSVDFELFDEYVMSFEFVSDCGLTFLFHAHTKKKSNGNMMAGCCICVSIWAILNISEWSQGGWSLGGDGSYIQNIYKVYTVCTKGWLRKAKTIQDTILGPHVLHKCANIIRRTISKQHKCHSNNDTTFTPSTLKMSKTLLIQIKCYMIESSVIYIWHRFDITWYDV